MKNFVRIGLNVVIVLFLGWMPGRSEALTRTEAYASFVQAARHYRAGEFESAVAAYEEIIDAGWESGPVYYNLANAWFRLGKMGQAILNYERALQLMPRDSDLQYNERYARRGLSLENPARSRGWWVRLWDRHVRFYTLGEMVTVVTVLVVLMVGVWLAARWWRWPVRRLGCTLGGLAILLMIFLTGLVFKVQYQRQSAFVIEAVAATFEPRDAATVHFHLREGERVRILREDSGWLKIQRPDGPMGWVPGDTVEAL